MWSPLPAWKLWLQLAACYSTQLCGIRCSWQMKFQWFGVLAADSAINVCTYPSDNLRLYLLTSLSIYLPIYLSRYLHISTYVPISSHHILVLYVGARWCESKCKVWIRPVLTSVPYPQSMPKWSKMQVHTVPYVWTTAERSIPNPWPTPISSPYLLCSNFIYSCNYLIPSYLIPSQPFSS